MKPCRKLWLCLPFIATGCIGDPTYQGEVRNDLSRDIVMTIESKTNLLVPAHQTVKLGLVLLYRGSYDFDLRDRQGRLLGWEKYGFDDIDSFHHGNMVTVVLDPQHFHPATKEPPKKRSH
jgi:hypothetical protein